jgi:hypothetical protein
VLSAASSDTNIGLPLKVMQGGRRQNASLMNPNKMKEKTYPNGRAT